MRTPPVAPLSIFLIALLVACGSGPKPSPKASPFAYRHTREFMWDQVRKEILENWKIAEEDAVLGSIVTDWDVHLAPMAALGRRHRLTVTLEGDEKDGFRPAAVQESEMNGNQRNPLIIEEAEWSATESDGALAQRFLANLHGRLNPSQPWKEEGVR